MSDRAPSLINSRAQYGRITILLCLHRLDKKVRIMGGRHIDIALERLEAALTRIEAAKAHSTTKSDAASSPSEPSSERVTALVNAHEKLREEVSETLRELDQLIEDHS